MEYQGLTGVAYVEISGPIGGGKLLEAKQGQQYPVIASQPSNFQELFSGAPDLIKGGTVLVGELTKLVNEKNRAAFSKILANTATVTDEFAARSNDFGQFLSSLKDTSHQVGGAAHSINGLAPEPERIGRYRAQARSGRCARRGEVGRFAVRRSQRSGPAQSRTPSMSSRATGWCSSAG